MSIVKRRRTMRGTLTWPRGIRRAESDQRARMTSGSEASGLPEQLRYIHAERLRQLLQSIERDVDATRLDLLVVPRIEASSLGDLLLR